MTVVEIPTSIDVAAEIARSFYSKNHHLRELQLIVDACPLATFITDKAGDYLYVNAAFQELTGRSGQEVLGTGWRKAIHPADVDEIVARWAESIFDESTFEHEYRYIRPTGVVTPVHCKAVKLPDSGYVGYINALESSQCRFKCSLRS